MLGMHSTTPFLSRNTCRRCLTASNVARSFCDCTTPRCADCAAVPCERELSWEGVVDGRDVWLCFGCAEERADEAAIENAIQLNEAAE